jgi:hypothetical protein
MATIPLPRPMIFAGQGADHLHVVDLDGAFAGESVNGEAVASIVSSFPARCNSAAASATAPRSRNGSTSACRAS